METFNWKECLEEIQKGHDLFFIFKHEAEKFTAQAKLETEYEDGDLLDDEHLKVKGYDCNLYWMSR